MADRFSAEDLFRIGRVLEANKKKNFVQRILEPDKFPSLPLPEEGENVSGTHKMAYATMDKGAMVYPEIIQDKTGDLVWLKGNKAIEHALKTGEFISFPDTQEADWFSRNYKAIWGGKFNE